MPAARANRGSPKLPWHPRPKKQLGLVCMAVFVMAFVVCDFAKRLRYSTLIVFQQDTSLEDQWLAAAAAAPTTTTTTTSSTYSHLLRLPSSSLSSAARNASDGSRRDSGNSTQQHSKHHSQSFAVNRSSSNSSRTSRSAPTTTTTTIPTTTTTTVWCFLDRSNTITFDHFPHALQALSQCWSFFQSQQERLQLEHKQQRTQEDNDASLGGSLASMSRHPEPPPPRQDYNCIIHLTDMGRLKSVHTSWRTALMVQVMNCTIVQVYVRQPFANTTLRPQHPHDDNKDENGKDKDDYDDYANDDTSLWESPPHNSTNRMHYTFRPNLEPVQNFHYFWQSHHAQALRNRLVDWNHHHNNNNRTMPRGAWVPENETKASGSMTPNDPSDGETASNNQQQQQQQSVDSSVPRRPPLRIGLVDRLTTRRIGNLNELEQAIQTAHPHALVDRVVMEELTPLQQFTWWSHQSVVILVHGAAAANLVFLPPNAAMIELFPPHYYWWGFWYLANSAHIRHYGYFPILVQQQPQHDNNSNDHRNTTTATMIEPATTPTTIPNTTNTNNNKKKKRSMKPRTRALLEDYRDNCKLQRRLVHRRISVVEPSIPHVLQLLQRALSEHAFAVDSSSNHNGTSLLYRPQFSQVESRCHIMRLDNSRNNFVSHLDDE